MRDPVPTSGGTPEEPEEPRLVEAEVVGLEPPPPNLWQRLRTRLKVFSFLLVLGLLLGLGGLVLTITIVGAPLGVPLMVLGGLCVVGALWVLLGGGVLRIHRGR